MDSSSSSSVDADEWQQFRCILPPDMYDKVMNSDQPLFSPSAQQGPVLHSMFSQEESRIAANLHGGSNDDEESEGTPVSILTEEDSSVSTGTASSASEAREKELTVDQERSTRKEETASVVSKLTGETPSVASLAEYPASSNTPMSLKASYNTCTSTAMRTPEQSLKDACNETFFFTPCEKASPSVFRNTSENHTGTPKQRSVSFSAPLSTTTQDTAFLNCDYIQNCNSPQTLYEMKAYLEQKGRYPALLCEVHKRLLQLDTSEQDKHFYNEETFDTNQRNLSYRSLPLDVPREAEEEQESSLVMSLSTTEHFSASASTMGGLFGTSILDFPNKSISPIPSHQQFGVSSRSRTKSTGTPDYSRVERLKERLVSMSNRLKETEDKATDTIQALQQDIESTTMEKQDLQRALQQATTDQENLQNILEQTRQQQENQAQAGRQQQQALAQKVESLQQEQHTQQHKQNQLEQQCQHLERNIQTTQEQLKLAEQERDVMVMGLQRAKGKEAKPNLSTSERKRIILEFTKNANISKAAIDATARALARSERYRHQERQQTAKMRQDYEDQLHEAGKTIAALEQQVDHLQDQLQELSHELIQSQREHQKDKQLWKVQETYHRRIKATEPSAVPMGLFRHVKAESEERRKQIESLLGKIAHLEKAPPKPTVPRKVPAPPREPRLAKKIPAPPPGPRPVAAEKHSKSNAVQQRHTVQQKTDKMQVAAGRALLAKSPLLRKKISPRQEEKRAQPLAPGRALLAKSPLFQKPSRSTGSNKNISHSYDRVLKADPPQTTVPIKSAMRKVRFAPAPPPARYSSPKTPTSDPGKENAVQLTVHFKSPVPPPLAPPFREESTKKAPVAPPPKRISPTGRTQKAGVFFSESPEEARSRVRFSMARQAGGRKGLQEKLKQVRSPRALQTLYQHTST